MTDNTLLQFELTVTDKWGIQDTDIVNVIVKDVTANTPPVADAGDDRIINGIGFDLQFSLDASGSYDPDGKIIDYSWTIYTLGEYSGSKSSMINSWRAYGAGVYSIEVTVTENNGASSTDTSQVTIVVS